MNTKRIAKILATTSLLVAAPVGVYDGAQTLAAHYSAPTVTYSYANRSTIGHTLRAANHTPARMGAFRSDAKIGTSDVVSVVRPAD